MTADRQERRTDIEWRRLMGIGDKLRLCVSCQEGLGDRSRGGLVRFEREDLTIPKSQFSGAVK